MTADASSRKWDSNVLFDLSFMLCAHLWVLCLASYETRPLKRVLTFSYDQPLMQLKKAGSCSMFLDVPSRIQGFTILRAGFEAALPHPGDLLAAESLTVLMTARELNVIGFYSIFKTVEAASRLHEGDLQPLAEALLPVVETELGFSYKDKNLAQSLRCIFKLVTIFSIAPLIHSLYASWIWQRTNKGWHLVMVQCHSVTTENESSRHLIDLQASVVRST